MRPTQRSGAKGVLCHGIAVLVALGCGGGSSSPRAPTSTDRGAAEAAGITRGDEIVPPGAVADLIGAAAAPPEPAVPTDVVPLTARMTPKPLHIPSTPGGRTSRFTFDGSRRGWFARLPSGRQALLTPIYGRGKVFLGGGFGSHQLFAYDARTGEREWVASAPDGGPSAAILENDKVLFNTESCTLFAVDQRTGRQLWSRWLGDPLMSQPAAANGLVFSGHIVDQRSPGGITPGTTGFGVGEGRVYGFTALRLRDGEPRWTQPISADVMNAPILDETSVFITTMDGTVWRFDQRTGRVLWRRALNATSAPWLQGDEVHLTVRARGEGRGRFEKAVILAKGNGRVTREHEAVPAEFLGGRPDDGGVQAGWQYEGSRPTIADGRIYQTIGNEVHCRDANTGELLWRRRYTNEVNGRPASPPAIAGSQLVFGTQDGVLFGLDIDTGMTTWAYDVGEPIATQPTVAHGWVYAATTEGSMVGLEVSDVSFDGWHMWGGNARHNGRVEGDAPPVEEDERPGEGTLRLGNEPREGEAAGFPLRGTRVSATVSGFVARVQVEQTFHNAYDRPVEAVYLFPLPDDAAVDAMELRAGTRVVRAQIRRREQARREYDDARNRGVLASLLEQERPNLFRQSVANIRPGDEIRVVLTYTQVLPYEEGSYRFVYPMVAGPRYDAAGSAPGTEGTRQVVLAPGGERPDRVAISIDADLGTAVREVTSPTHELEVDRDGDRRLHVELADDARPDRDLDVRFAVAGAAPTVGLLASPPVADEHGNFSLAIHPRLGVTDDEVMPRELVFVVDTSSSMNGRPIELAKAAMVRALQGLRPTDTFRVLSFSDRTSALSDAPLPASGENIARGQRFVRQMRALGATEMKRGLRAALEPASDPTRMRIVLLMTDGYIGNETEIFREVNQRLGQSRLFAFGVGSAVNRYLLTRLAEVGRGDMQVVTLDERPEAAADRFHRRIARPYITDLAIDWGALAVHDAYPRRLPDLYADRPLVVHARYGAGGTGDVVIRGRLGGRAFAQTVQVSLPTAGESRPELTSVWARTRIRDLMTAMELEPNAALQEEVTQLGLRHHLLTEWTAFLAIDEGYRVDGEAQTVQQPSPLPAGMDPAADRGQRAPSAPRADEPMPAAASSASASAEEVPADAFAGERAPQFEALEGIGNGGGGYGHGSGPAMRRSAHPARPRSMAGRAGGTSHCYELARRPDGTIDQAVLEDCLRNARAEKAGSLSEPKRLSVSDGPPLWRREHD